MGVIGAENPVETRPEGGEAVVQAEGRAVDVGVGRSELQGGGDVGAGEPGAPTDEDECQVSTPGGEEGGGPASDATYSLGVELFSRHPSGLAVAQCHIMAAGAELRNENCWQIGPDFVTLASELAWSVSP